MMLRTRTPTRLLAVLAMAGLALGACSRQDPIDAIADELVEERILGDQASSGPPVEPSVEASASEEPAPPPVDDPRQFTLTLAGGGQPGGGDTSGTGTAVVTVERERICYRVEVDVDSEVTALHLHEGQPGTEGEVLRNLEPPVDGTVEACTELDAELAARIVAEPASFYVNVHTQAHPMGAIRAQFA